MKILLISPLPPPSGGIATWTKRLLESSYAKENQIININTSVTGNRVSNFKKRKFFDEIVRAFKIIKKVNNATREYGNFDVIHLNTSCSSLGLIRDYLSIRNIKTGIIVVHFRCDIQYMIGDNKIAKLFLKKIIKIADKLIVLNRNSEEYILKNFQRKSYLLPNFTSDKCLNNTKKELKVNKMIKNIIFVGHVTKAKGCDVIYKIAEKFPEMKFSLIGYISEEIKQLNKPANVLLCGEMDNDLINDYLLSSDVFIFPTLTEGFPNAVVEAMSVGLPIISTPVGAIPEMIENKGGILCEPGNLLQFTDAINKIKNDEIREKMGLFNKEKVAEKYSMDSVLIELNKIYQEE